MKKLLGCLLCVMLFVCLSGPVSAATYPPDQFLSSTTLAPGDKNPAGEKAWLETFLGYSIGDYIDTKTPSGNTIEDFNPNIGGWTYAIVKIGEGGHSEDWLFAYLDMPDGISSPGNDNILTVNTAGQGNSFPYIRGVSHVDFFGPHSVPEPATLLLFGSGLVWLGVFGRKKIVK